jgi:stress-induced morphogen
VWPDCETEGRMTIEAGLWTKLEQAFAPETLMIENESGCHAHHIQVKEGGAGKHHRQTHFRVRIVSDAFAGKSRVERHRMIYTLLAEEMSGPVHALVIDAAVTPAEARG